MLVGMAARSSVTIRDRWRDRQLASSKRAGSWARGQARRLQLDLVKRNRRVLLLAAGMALLTAPALLLFSEGQRWFLLGALTAGVPALLYHVVVLASGSAPYLVGDLGEQWTRRELKSLRKAGWRIVHHLVFKAGRDIDTVLIGPAGVVVLETKWSSDRWTSPKQDPWIHQAVRQVQENHKIVERQIRQTIGPTKTPAAVVLWPSDPEAVPRVIDGVTVLPGQYLRTWLEELPRVDLDSQRLERAWAFLREHTAKRDDWERHHSDLVPRSFERFVADLMQYPLGVLAGTLGSAAIINFVDWPLASIPMVGLAAAASWIRRYGPVRNFGSATGLTVAVLVVAALALEALA